MTRCGWAREEQMIAYHDTEWGVPLHDDRALFEFLILEGAQAGLSWSTILRKRDNYRKAFDRFDARKIARYDDAKVAALLADAGIVRNRLKIASTISNAQAFLAVQKEFGSFDAYIWQLRRRQPATESLAQHGRGAREDRAVRRDEQRPREARLPLRRLHHLLRLHAGHRHGERSPGRAVSATGAADEARHAAPRWSAGSCARRKARSATRPSAKRSARFRAARSRPTGRSPPPPDIRSTTAMWPRCSAADTATAVAARGRARAARSS